MRTEAINRVKLVFNLFDVDGSGFLEADDFDLMSQRVVQAVPGADGLARNAMLAAFQKYWTTLVTELDANHDGRISFDEYTACVLAPERFDAAIAQFAESLAALGDPDGDGLVERPVFVALMTAIGFDLPNIHALFDVFGPTDSDRITVPIWVAAIKEFYHPEKAGIAGDHLVAIPAV